MARAPSSANRTDAQAAAARENGRHSKGPATSSGRAISSCNSLKTGLHADGVVMPGEDPDQVRELVEGTIRSFRLTSYAGAQLAQRAAGVFQRLGRADRLREKLLGILIEERVAASEANKALDHAMTTRASLEGLEQLARERTRGIRREDVASLLPALRLVAEAVLELRLLPRVGYPFAAVTGAIDSDDMADVPGEVVAALADACTAVIAAIDDRLPALRLDVETERENQAEMVLVTDDPRLRQIEKVRARLVKELESLFRAMKSLKELEVTGAAGAESPSPVVVEFRTVGGPR